MVKPLMETKISIRMEAKPYLGELAEACTIAVEKYIDYIATKKGNI